MSILTVKNMNHGFGDRAIFEDVSFRLLKGEHVGFVGANGEGKSTFMNIITSKLMPDEGKVIWSNKVRVGYMDQHAELEKGLTIRDVLRSAFKYLFDMEAEMNELYGRMGEMNEDEMNKALERTAVIQDMLDNNGFYVIDAKAEEVAKGLGLLDVGLDRDVTELSGGQRQRAYIAMVIAQNSDYILLDEPLNNLDMKHSVEIMKILRRLTDELGKTVIIVIHDINFASCYSDYIVALKDGKVVKDGPTDETIKKEELENIYEIKFDIQNIDNRKICVYF